MNDQDRVEFTAGDVSGYSSAIIAEVEKAVVGKREFLEKFLAGLLSSMGHILIEDFPGLAKTLVANSFASALGLEFKRIQFTPDLMPGDITGGYIFDREQNRFVLRKGPLFTNILLADEINRASPKTQSALLEAMQEHQVTMEGDTCRLPDPFLVVATQNPIEYEGTFPLPEAQLDRFILKLSIGYPEPEEEQQILEDRLQRREDAFTLQPVVNLEEFLAMKRFVERIYIHPDLQQYIVNIVSATRRHRQVVVGASPRGSLALMKLARSRAAVQGRDYVLPDDVKVFVREALSHRLILEPSLWGSKTTCSSILKEIVSSVVVPVLPVEHDR